MIEGLFKYEDDLLKHHVRREGWLPCCRKRLRTIRASSNAKTARRLRYFTFCAVGAIDVLMLDVAKVIRRSGGGYFDTVAFFDRSPEWVYETLKRIPGATGFPGDFTQVVLTDDPDEDLVVDGGEPLSSARLAPDESAERGRQIRLAQRQAFVRSFPFDVVNLDLEEFLFKPHDPFPGRVINTLRKLFAWQKRGFSLPGSGKQHFLDEFSLMFTTQIGPPNISDEYLMELRQCLTRNLEQDEGLHRRLNDRTGYDDVVVLQQNSFDEFFRLATPKLIAAALMDEDWFVDSDPGITIFEFDRVSQDGPYKILHMVMDVKRHQPPKEQRAPGAESLQARAAYREVVRQLFSRRENFISLDGVDQDALRADLDKIKSRRRLYELEADQKE